MSPLPGIHVLFPRPGIALVECTGEHDLTTTAEIDALLTELVAEHKRVVVDVTKAIFVDSSFLNNLLKADRLAEQESRTFVLQLGTAPIVRSAFQYSGALEIIDHAPTREEALGPRGDRPRKGHRV